MVINPTVNSSNDSFILVVLGGFWKLSSVMRIITLGTAALFQDIIHDTHGSMPVILQDKSMFSVLGLCITDPTSKNLMDETEDDKKKFSNCGDGWAEGSSLYRENKCGSCSCLQIDGSLRKSNQSFLGESNWVLLMFDSPEQNDAGNHGNPKLHHIHWNGQTLSNCDVHVCKSLFLLLPSCLSASSCHLSLLLSPSPLSDIYDV